MGVELPTDRPLTTGVLARVTGYSRDRVQHVVRVLKLHAVLRAGHLRVFDRETAKQIVRELDRIEKRVAGQQGGKVGSAEGDEQAWKYLLDVLDRVVRRAMPGMKLARRQARQAITKVSEGGKP